MEIAWLELAVALANHTFHGTFAGNQGHLAETEPFGSSACFRFRSATFGAVLRLLIITNDSYEF
jgi:hypothetical protein